MSLRPSTASRELLLSVGIGSAAILATGFVRLWRHRLPAGRPLDCARQLLIGHRGCRLGAPPGSDPPPENTLEAFEYCLDKGAHGFELDTRLTRDGHAVVFHDSSIGRCLIPGPGGNVPVSQLTLKELQQLPFAKAPETRVPTLEEAVALASARQAHILIETKDLRHSKELALRVVELVRKHDMVEKTLVISFDPRSLYHIRKAAPEIRTCFLWWPKLFTHYAFSGAEALPLPVKLLAPLLDTMLCILAHPALLPSFLGVSAVGPQSAYRRTFLDAAWRRGMGTYLWVVNDAELRSDVEGLHSRGLWAYSTDRLWPQ